MADNTLKVTAVPLALVIYLTLSGVYPLLSSVIVRQLFINKLLPLLIEIVSPSRKFFARLLCSGSRDLTGEIFDLLRKINIVLILL